MQNKSVKREKYPSYYRCGKQNACTLRKKRKISYQSLSLRQPSQMVMPRLDGAIEDATDQLKTLFRTASAVHPSGHHRTPAAVAGTLVLPIPLLISSDVERGLDNTSPEDA
jgi:hypothetical protein